MRSILLALFVAFSFASNAQRFTPVIEEGRDIDKALQGPDGRIFDADIYNNELILVGDFTTVNELSANRVCAWNGSQFSNFGDELTGLTGTTRFLDVCSTPNGVFIAGNINSHNNIIFGTGGAWETPGEGLNDRVFDLEWYDGKLIACGRFEYSGSTPLASIASWDGSNWSAMGQGMNDDVSDLIVYENELYACGDFTEAGGQAANHFAKWNGLSWEAVGNGFDNVADCMIEFEGDLIIGGSFDNSGDGTVPYPNIASFNGTEISSDFEVVEPSNYSYMCVLDGQLRIQDGSLINPSPNGTFILNGNTIQPLPSTDPVITRAFEFQGKTYALNLDAFTSTGDEEYYLNNSLLHYHQNGSIQSWIQNENVSGSIYPSATIFQNRNSTVGLLSPTIESGTGTIYNASPWLSTKDAGNQLSGNYQTYHTFSDFSDKFAFGPKSDSYDQEYVDRYMQVWALSAQEIAEHIANFDQGGYEMPSAIETWPGNGRVEHGEQSHLAPFIDVDENGWYQPHLGDYPLIKGEQCVYYLLCDSHGQYFAQQPSGTEIEVMLYSFDAENSDLSHTIFVNYTIRNATDMDFAELKFGMWTDGDIGTAADDFAGSSPEDDLYFFFNGNPNDLPSSTSSGYGDSIPAQGTLFLSHAMSSFMIYNEGGGGGNGEPGLPLEFDNMLNAKWSDGQPQYFGGDGYNSGTIPGQAASFIFPTDPNIISGDEVWNEISVGNSPGDRRGIGSAETTSLGIGESICFDLAFVTAFPDQAGLNPALSVTKLKERSAAIKEFYQTLEYVCVAQTFPLDVEEEELKNFIKLYPNPANSQIRVEGFGQQIQRIDFYDMSGRLVMTKNNVAESQSISIENLDAGIYLINIELQGLPVQQSKLVKL